MGRVITVKGADFSQNAVSQLIQITVDVSQAGGGNVSGGGLYDVGDEIEIKATPNEGYKFDRWSDGSTNATRTVTVGSTRTYTATFVVAMAWNSLASLGRVEVGIGAAHNPSDYETKEVAYARRAERGVWMVPTNQATYKISFASDSITAGPNTGMTVAEMTALGRIPLIMDRTCIGKTITFNVGAGGNFRFAIAFMRIKRLLPAVADYNDPYDSGWIFTQQRQTISEPITAALFGNDDYIATNLSVSPLNDNSSFTQADLEAITQAVVTIY